MEHEKHSEQEQAHCIICCYNHSETCKRSFWSHAVLITLRVIQKHCKAKSSGKGKKQQPRNKEQSPELFQSIVAVTEKLELNLNNYYHTTIFLLSPW